MPKKTMTPEEMKRFAHALQAAKERGVLSAGEHRRLHVAFVATDYAAQRWSVGLRTGVWSRLDEGKWVAAEPPDRLHIDEALIAELEALVPSDAGPATGLPAVMGGTAPAGAAARPLEFEERRCPQCGARLGAGEAFCPQDGTHVPIAADPGVAPEQEAGARPDRIQAPPARRAAGPRPPRHNRANPGASTPADWGPVFLCLAIALALAAGGWTRASMGAYVLAAFFTALAVLIVLLDHLPRRA